MSGRAAELQERFESAIFLHRTGRLDEAAAIYRALLLEAPHVALLHYNYGLVLRARGDREAAASFREALRLQPGMAEAHVNLANALYPRGDLAEAERHCRDALRLAPDLAQAYSNLGNILRDQGRLDESVAAFEAALQRWPNDDQVHNNLGNTLKALGRLAEAEAAYRVALRHRPGNAEVLYNLGTLHLAAGRFAEGWPGYEHRWQTGLQGARPFDGPIWQGEAAHESRVLVYAEQGLGDTIQFCRYLPSAAARARVTFVAPAALRRLLTSLHPAVTVICPGDPVPAYTFQCALQSLPLIFDTIPAHTPYLHPEAQAVARWQARLAPLRGLRVGLVWAGNPDNPTDRRRSIGFEALGPLLARPELSLVSLQKGSAGAPARARSMASRIRDWTGELADFADTAALIAALDVVIGVDTAVVHLAGALGKPVWLLNRFDTDWRWMLGRDDSPWYPTLRQFRQARPGDWDGVVDQVLAALDAE